MAIDCLLHVCKRVNCLGFRPWIAVDIGIASVDAVLYGVVICHFVYVALAGHFGLVGAQLCPLPPGHFRAVLTKAGLEATPDVGEVNLGALEAPPERASLGAAG